MSAAYRRKNFRGNGCAFIQCDNNSHSMVTADNIAARENSAVMLSYG